VATVAAYVVMFAGMAWWSQRIYPAPYQWRRVATAVAAGIALAAAGKLADAGLPLAIALTAMYPLVLVPLGFLLPVERAALRRRLAGRSSSRK
jgi:hypothetical protein